jgi:agmatinase
MSFAYLSGNTFLKVSAKYNKSKPLAIAGICWDGSVTNRPGTRFGPSGIRTASHMLCDGYHPHFDTTPMGVLTDAGDFQLPNTSLEDMRLKLKPQVLSLLKQHQHLVWLGGDHSITFPLLQCYHQVHGTTRPIAVLHFDAHCDTWPTHFDEPSGHGTWVYEAIESGVVSKECFFQFGIRSSGSKTVREYVHDQGGMIYTARDLRGLESPAQLRPIINNVCSRLAEYDNPPVYVSFDIDCLDPAFAPGTGTPEPGGLTSNQALTFLEEFVTRIPNIIGMDLVEVAPAYDHAELTTNVASTLVWTYMCGVIAKSPEMKLLQVPPYD